MHESYFIKFRKGFFRSTYAYLDHLDNIADMLFAQNDIKVRFKGDFHNPDGQFKLVFCSVNNKDIERFEDALAKLPNIFLIRGCFGSEQAWNHILGSVTPRINPGA